MILKRIWNIWRWLTNTAFVTYNLNVIIATIDTLNIMWANVNNNTSQDKLFTTNLYFEIHAVQKLKHLQLFICCHTWSTFYNRLQVEFCALPNSYSYYSDLLHPIELLETRFLLLTWYFSPLILPSPP